MKPRDRIAAAMKLQTPDRVPYWCQLSTEHIYRNTLPEHQSGPETIEQHVECECAMARRYGFDAMLLHYSGGVKNQRLDVAPPPAAEEQRVAFEAVDPEKWIRHRKRATADEMVPALLARQILGEDLHIGGWVPDAFNCALNWCGGVEPGMLALIDDPQRFLALVNYFCQDVIDCALDQILVGGMESIHISSPFAGSSFISRDMYAQFVLEPMKRLVAAIEPTPAFSYIHNCGFLGDRLELLADSGADGIECMDPPPLGDVELADAKRRIGSRVFLKGNLDSVNVLLRGRDEAVERAVRSCLSAGMPRGGYILSTACSTARDVPPERMLRIRELVEIYGQYEASAHAPDRCAHHDVTIS
jgi:uroporphyrinogen-III decarboxylase